MEGKPLVLGVDGMPSQGEWKRDPIQPKRMVPIGKLMHIQILIGVGAEKQVQQVAGGIHIPDSVKWVTPVVRVIAVGPKCEQAKEGDYLLISKDVGIHEVRYSDVITYVCHEDGVFGQLLPDEVKKVNELLGIDQELASQEAGQPPCCQKDGTDENDKGGVGNSSLAAYENR